jgi:hypothetical protein
MNQDENNTKNSSLFDTMGFAWIGFGIACFLILIGMGGCEYLATRTP